jgi:hypothetical protein
MRLLAQLDFDRYSPRIYLVASGDHLSLGKAQELEAYKQSQTVSRSDPRM